MPHNILEIQDLARLYLKTQKLFGEGNYADNAAFEKAFNEYCAHHEALREVYPDDILRAQELAVRVRAIAKRLLDKNEVTPPKVKSRPVKI